MQAPGVEVLSLLSAESCQLVRTEDGFLLHVEWGMIHKL
jgi:hypothetical protein